MLQKQPVNPRRVRRIPSQFSWVDHHLARNRYFERFSHESAALYLFLVTVADSRGLSYYSDATLARRLRMDESVLRNARQELASLDLIAWKKPIYQVMPLQESHEPQSTPSPGGNAKVPASLRRILSKIAEGEQ